MSSDRASLRRALGFILIVVGGCGVWVACVEGLFLVRGNVAHGDLVGALVLAPITVLLGARLRPSWMSTLGWTLVVFALITFLMAVATVSTRPLRERGVPDTYAIAAGVLLLAGVLLGVLGRVRSHRDRADS